MDPLEQALQQTLVVRCQLGDAEALEALFLRHHRALAYFLRRMLDRHDVDDVQQEVWLTVMRKIRQLRNPEAFVVWLYQIARRRALTWLDARDRAASMDEPHTVADVGDAPDATFSVEDAERIHRELGRLNPLHREVLLLRFMEDLSYDQIAEITACSPGTVRSRLHYAKVALKRRMEMTE